MQPFLIPTHICNCTIFLFSGHCSATIREKMTTTVKDASRSASSASEQPPPPASTRVVGGGQQEIVVVAAENSRLQRHRSYHSQSKTHRRLEKFQESPRHRRAISVRYVICDFDFDIFCVIVEILIFLQDVEKLEINLSYPCKKIT